MISLCIPLAVLALVAVASAASNSGWVPARLWLIRWTAGEDAIVLNAELFSGDAALTLRHGQSGMMSGCTLHGPKYIILVSQNWNTTREASLRRRQIILDDVRVFAPRRSCPSS
jgi:hypothetical protein